MHYSIFINDPAQARYIEIMHTIASKFPSLPVIVKAVDSKDWQRLQAEDVAILYKTGANVAHKAMQAHLVNEFSLPPPNFQIYSDYPQWLEGVEIIDILQSTSTNSKYNSQQDFAAYRTQKEKLDFGTDSEVSTYQLWRLDK